MLLYKVYGLAKGGRVKQVSAAKKGGQKVCPDWKFKFQTSIVKQLGLGSLRNFHE